MTMHVSRILDGADEGNVYSGVVTVAAGATATLTFPVPINQLVIDSAADSIVSVKWGGATGAVGTNSSPSTQAYERTGPSGKPCRLRSDKGYLTAVVENEHGSSADYHFNGWPGRGI